MAARVLWVVAALLTAIHGAHSSLVFSTRADDPLRQYILQHSLRLTDEQRDLEERSERELGFPAYIQPEEIQLVQMLVSLAHSRLVLDIGVDRGLVSMAMAYNLLPGGKVVGLTKLPTTGEMAAPYWDKAGLAASIDLRVVIPLHELKRMVAAGESGWYDLVFIDGTNQAYNEVYEVVLQLVRRGGVIVIDNVLLNGEVVGTMPGRRAYVIDQLNERIYGDERVDMVLLPIGDGFTVLRRR